VISNVENKHRVTIAQSEDAGLQISNYMYYQVLQIAKEINELIAGYNELGGNVGRPKRRLHNT